MLLNAGSTRAGIVATMSQQIPPPEDNATAALLETAAADTAAFVAFLSSPGTYRQGGGTAEIQVEVKETHKSWVFLCGDEVYKLKKPVRNHLQDLSTLAAREQNSLNEVWLNRRLAPDIYLGVKALTRAPSGQLAIEGEGTVVDWLVHMRRVPEACLLDQMILHGEVAGERIEALMDVLTRFYRGLAPASVTPCDYVARFEEQQIENRRILSMARFPLDHGAILQSLDAFDSCLTICRPLLELRVTSGAVVEGHGDLRPEHVCLIDPPVVIDCLEFNKDLRIVDPYDEIIYLGLECALLGAPGIKGRLTNGYAARSQDNCPAELLRFYEAYRAFLRARLCLAHLLDPGPQDEEKWMRKTRGYVDAADRALISLEIR